jgi:hypothetical protein
VKKAKKDTRWSQEIVASVTRPKNKVKKRIAKNFGTSFEPDRWGLFEVEKDNNPPFFVLRTN